MVQKKFTPCLNSWVITIKLRRLKSSLLYKILNNLTSTDLKTVFILQNAHQLQDINLKLKLNLINYYVPFH